MKIRIKIEPMYLEADKSDENYFYEIYSQDDYFKVINEHIEKNHKDGFDVVFTDVGDWFYIRDKGSMSKNHDVLFNQVVEKIKQESRMID